MVKTLFKRGVSIGSKALSSEIGKRLIDEGIKHVPERYRLGTSTIKNKILKYYKIKNITVRNALDSDVANYIWQETQKKAKEDFNNFFGGM